jgi:hypothetical protein
MLFSNALSSVQSLEAAESARGAMSPSEFAMRMIPIQSQKLVSKAISRSSSHV